jgi:uncharacterized protein (TIRG00374 family)
VLRHGLVLGALALAVEYLVVPRLVGAGRHVDLLGRIHVGWLVAGLALEAAALFCYALLTRTLLPGGGPGLSRLVRITLATTAVEHVLPAGMVTGPGLGFQLLTADGVAAADAAFVLAGQAIGSAVVLNAVLWVALVTSLPLAGAHPVYLVVAALGLAALLGGSALLYTVTRGEERTVRAVRRLGARIPRVGADRLEGGVRRIGDSVARLARSPRLLVGGTVWAALNWLLDAASLGAFLAAFGGRVNPVLLFVAYGVANVLAVLPLVPAGLGIVEASSVSLLVAFGLPIGAATFGVLAWRLVNFWLPIPVGAAAYLSLRLPRGARQGSRGRALADLFGPVRPGPPAGAGPR